MNYTIEQVAPEAIEKRSFEIIESELKAPLNPDEAPIIKRVIHTSADFDYATNLVFSTTALAEAKQALLEGATIITDTNMAKAGINKAALTKLGCFVKCFMADEDVAQMAKEAKTTRAIASMNKALNETGNLIFAIGNAPTALIHLHDLIKANKLKPALIIGVPVGFVNVVQSKELIMQTKIPYIVARGRKGGSNVAAAIVNALMYTLIER